jgi:hypothetical protein
MEDRASGNRPSREVRLWAMLCHLSAFAGLIFPFGNLLGPLIVWQLKRDLDPYLDDHGREALNFQLSVILAVMVCFLLMFVIIGFPLMIVVSAGALILTVIAAVKANEGVAYRYPFCLRLVK